MKAHKFKRFIAFFLAFSFILFVPKTVAFAFPERPVPDITDLVDPQYYTVTRQNTDSNYYLAKQLKDLNVRRNFYSSTDNSTHVGNGFLNTTASNNSNSFNKMYLYNKSTTTNNTSTYSPMYVSNSGNTSTTTNYNWYNPVTNKYEVNNNWTYSPTYNTFNYTTNNYNYYVTNNNTYISYYVMPTTENTADDAESLYFEIYFELPDGRDSYDLTADDVWGTYFCYNAVNYDYVAEDDGTTLGLWHLNNNLKDSSYWANSTGKAYSSTYKDGGLSSGKFLGTSTSDYFTLPLDKVSFSPSSPYTLEWLEYTPKQSNTVSAKADESQPHWNSGANSYILGTQLNYIYYYSACGLGGTYPCWETRNDDFTHYAICYDGSSYSAYVNGVKVNVFTSNAGNYCGVSLSSNEIKYGVFTSSRNYMNYRKGTGNSLSQYLRETYGMNWSSSSNFSLNENITETRFFNQNSIIDEVRLSKGVIYKSDFEPPSQEFITNMVFVLPESAQNGDFAIQSQYAVNGFRVGGVKPTYPSNGYVYVYEENDKVKSVQQYQGNGWYEVGASIYVDGAWKQADNYDLSTFKLSGDDENGGSTSATALKITRQPKDKKAHSGDTVTLSLKASGDGLVYKWQKSADGNTWENVGGDAPTLAVTVSSEDGFDYENGKFRCVVTDSGGLVAFSDSVSITIVPDDEEIPPEKEPTDETDETKEPDDIDDTDYTGLFSGVKKIFKVFTGLFKTVIDGVSSLLSTALGFITNLTDVTGQFGDFLSAMFSFIPKEIFSVITLGITIIITVAVIKFIRG